MSATRGSADTGFAATIQDLRRRKVFRAAAAYGVGAWLVVEMSSVVLPALDMPDWTLRAVIIAAAAGFPLFLILAWIFDLTPDGLVRSVDAQDLPPDADVAPTLKGGVARAIDAVIIGILLLLAVWLWQRPAVSGDQVSMQGPSIAVLSFDDLSEAGDSEYFADGIAEELLNSLAKIEGLHVPSRTSSFAFRGSQQDIRTIGERLNVQTVLEGSVRRVGNEVRITAQLIDATNGFHLWSETYDRELDDIFAVQDEIAAAIVSALKRHLVMDDDMKGAMNVATAEVASIEAYDLYLLGRHHWHQRTAESLNRSIELFEKAIAADPRYAPAYTGLADAYLLLVGYGDMDRQTAQRKAEPLIATALSLDPELAEPYASQGLMRWIRGDYAAAELALRAAVERNPNYSMASMWLGGVLGEEHRYAESLAAYQNAWAADPLHPVINSNLAATFLKMGRFDEARDSVRRMTSLGQEPVAASILGAEIEAQAGNLESAINLATTAAEKHPDNVKLPMMIAGFHSMVGNQEAARGWLGKAEAAGIDGPHMRMMLYTVLLRIGEVQRFAETADELLAEVPDWRTARLDDEQRAMLLWPGLARIIDGRLADGLEMLGYADVQSGISGLAIESQVAILGMMAHAEMQLDMPAARIATRLERAATIAREARANGWQAPGMQVRLAIIEAMRGNVDEAAELMNAAVNAGWRDLYLELSVPGSEILERPEFRPILNRVEQDLARTRQRMANA